MSENKMRRKNTFDPNILDPNEVKKGSDAFPSHERRDAIYNVSIILADHFWGNFPRMADALGVLLLVWNNAFYRYGLFDYDALERVLREKIDDLNKFKERDIEILGNNDEKTITALFTALLNGLAIAEGKSKGLRSQVSVAKALHLLAPGFFPLCDNKIAKAYHCHYLHNPSETYFQFMKTNKVMAEN